MFTKILFLFSAVHSGDVAHADAVYASLALEVAPLTRYDINVDCDAATLVSRFREITREIGEEKYVIYATGEKGIETLDILNQDQEINKNNTYIGLGVHQYFDKIKKLNLNYIAIPKAAIDTLEKTWIIEAIKKYTLTFAVPINNPALDALKKSYEEWDIDNKPELHKKYIIVMLPGDAPNNDGMQYFTINSANKLFSDIKRLLELNPEHYLIVQNGPRTGKYDPTTNEVACTHEYKKGKEDSSIAIDHVSGYFVSLLQQNQISHCFFNFAFEVEGTTKKANSVFNQLLYIAQADKDNFFIIPGESVSMMGQIPLYVSSFNAIVFKPSSMNDSHEAIFQDAFDRNFVSFIDENGLIVHPQENLKRDLDDAHQVTNDLIGGYQAEMIGNCDVPGDI